MIFTNGHLFPLVVWIYALTDFLKEKVPMSTSEENGGAPGEKRPE
jgi:hypothetical protein